jgi:hypothetical protein
MANEISFPKGFGALPSVFAGAHASNDELGAGVASSYGIIGYKGKVWSIRYQGNEQILMRDDGDGPRNSIEVVLVKASPAISKIFYRNGYVEGSNASPDCWSANGQIPDASVQNKVNRTCADCPMNAWGSRVTESGKQNKACSDSRRVAVVPVADLDNELFGGPMLLRVPAASLKDLKGYGDALNSFQYPYYAVATRISFDPKEAYPKFAFSAIRALSEEEGRRIMELRDDKRVATVLSEAAEAAIPAAAPAARVEPPRPASPFEVDQMAPAPQPQPAAQSNAVANPFANRAPAQPAQVTQPAPAPQPVAQSAPLAAAPVNDNPASSGVQSFDDMLNGLLS